MKFYEENPHLARGLIQKQVQDGWSDVEIRNYWYALGYDLFFVKNIVDDELSELKKKRDANTLDNP